MQVAFKVSRNPSAAGGGWRSARGFLGLWLLGFSHRCRFLTLGFNFVVAAGGTLGWQRSGLSGSPPESLAHSLRRAELSWATQEPSLRRAARIRPETWAARAHETPTSGAQPTELYTDRATFFLLLQDSLPGAAFAPARADFGWPEVRQGCRKLGPGLVYVGVFPRRQSSRSLYPEPRPLELSFRMEGRKNDPQICRC